MRERDRNETATSRRRESRSGRRSALLRLYYYINDNNHNNNNNKTPEEGVGHILRCYYSYVLPCHLMRLDCCFDASSTSILPQRPRGRGRSHGHGHGHSRPAAAASILFASYLLYHSSWLPASATARSLTNTTPLLLRSLARLSL